MKEWFAELRYKLAYWIYPEFFDDMEERLSGLLCHTTGGLLSKTNYTLQGMITAVDDYQQRCCDECEYYLDACRTEKGSVEYALECIVWYNGHYEWLEPLVDELEKVKGYYPNPFEADEWHTERHCVWMLLVGMFGDWGTSIRGGWIEQTKECAEYIRNLCAKAKGEEGAE